MKSTGAPRILVVVKDDDRAAVIHRGLDTAGCRQIVSVSDLAGLTRRAVDEMADLLLIDLGNPAPAALDEVFDVVRAVNRPVVIFIDTSSPAATKAAMEAGVSAYIINDLRAERIEPIIDMAISRFATQKDLKDKLASTEQALRDRKIIDRAKGLLMSRKGLTEREAYRLLQQTAMNKERRLADVAQSVVNAAELLD